MSVTEDGKKSQASSTPENASASALRPAVSGASASGDGAAKPTAAKTAARKKGAGRRSGSRRRRGRSRANSDGGRSTDTSASGSQPDGTASASEASDDPNSSNKPNGPASKRSGRRGGARGNRSGKSGRSRRGGKSGQNQTSRPPVVLPSVEAVEIQEPEFVSVSDVAMEMGPEVQEQFVKAAERLGIERLHPEQERAILHSLQGRDALVVLPTGYGKSACYQIPSMILPKPVVVVSPLLALLEDQTRNLEKRNVPVVRVDGTVRGKARREAMARIAEGGPLL